jgi:hypothetical protein
MVARLQVIYCSVMDIVEPKNKKRHGVTMDENIPKRVKRDETQRENSPLSGYFIIDEGHPMVYTLFDDDNNEIEIDEGGDVSANVVRFTEHGWELYGNPWTYNSDGRRYQCQAVVCYKYGRSPKI